MTNEYIKGGDVDLVEITLTRLTDGYTTSIKPQVKEINIYESLFSNFIHGQILFYDAIGLYNDFPIVGEESIRIEYGLPGQNEVDNVEIEGHVFTVENLDNDDSNLAAGYIIKFISLEKRFDIIESVDSPYTDNISNMVQKIVKDHLKSSKTLEVEETFGEQQLVFPRISPTDALKVCISRAVSQTNLSSSYVFFESLDQSFYFKTIEQIIKDAKSGIIRTYTLSPQEFNINTGTGSARDIEFQKIVNFYPKKRFNTLAKFKKGLLDSELLQFDIITKKQTSTKFKYRDMFNKVEHIDDRSSGKLLTDEFLQEHESESQFDGTRAEYSYMMTDSSKPPTHFEQSYGYRKMYINSIMDNLTTVVLPGNPSMRSGQMIRIDVPVFAGTTDGLQNDNYMSENFLITSLKTTISGESAYAVTADLVKDSYLNEIDLKGVL